MSQDYDNNLRGVLFKNDRKEKDTHPDYKGSCEIEGVEFWMSAWIKEGREGKGKFMSISFEQKDAPKNPPARQPVKQTREQQRGRDSHGFDSMDDDIPF